MSTITDNATLVLKPALRNTGKLYAYNPQDPSNPKIEFTVTRNGQSSEKDNEGYIRFQPANVPTFTWVDGKWTIQTQLASTNLLSKPYAFENTYWTKSGASIELDPSTAGSELISSTCVNSDYDVFDGASSSGFHCKNTAGGTQRAGTADEIVVEKGKSYKIEFDLSLTSGNLPDVRLRVGFATSPSIYAGTAKDGFNIFYVNSDDNFTGIIEFSSDTTEYTVSNLTVKEVQGFSSPFKDSSGNVVKCARKLVDGGSGDIQHYIQAANISVANGNTYSISAILKYLDREWVRISGANGGYAYFNLSTGTIGTEINSTATIKELANGYYLCTVTYVALDTTTDVKITLAEDDMDVTFTAAGSSVYVAGAQFEEGKPTSIIVDPTADLSLSSSFSREGDSIKDATISGNYQEGMLFAEWDGKDLGITQKTGLYGVGDTQISLDINSNGTVLCYLMQSDGAYTFIAKSDSLIGHHKAIFKWNATTINLFIDGVKLSTKSHSIVINNGDVTKFTLNDGYQPFYSDLYQEAVMTYLSDEDCINLTKL